MSVDAAFQGSLFDNDFLCESVVETSDWQALGDAALDEFEAEFRAIFDGFPIADAPNESQTEAARGRPHIRRRPRGGQQIVCVPILGG